MKIYHASLSNIPFSDFTFDKGVHLGGLNSALEAGLRKSEASGFKDIYLHTFNFNDDKDKCLLVDDVGCQEEWDKVIQEAKSQQYQIIKYKNKYEPDIFQCYSYLFLTSSNLQLQKVEKISYNKAEDMLEFYSNF